MVNINLHLDAPWRPWSDETINYPPHTEHTSPQSSAIDCPLVLFFFLYSLLWSSFSSHWFSTTEPTSHQGSTPVTWTSRSLSAFHNPGFFGINTLEFQWAVLCRPIVSVPTVTTDTGSIELLPHGREINARKLREVNWSGNIVW